MLRALPACLLALSAAPALGAESYDSCAGTITSLPATISTQGVWCLRSDLATAITSGNAISITTNNVTLDCNGFKLGGLAGGPATTAAGVWANYRENISVRHCTIRGFYMGVNLNGGSGHVVEDNRFDGNTHAGIRVGYADAVDVRHNVVTNTGGTYNGDSNFVRGISVESGSAVVVRDNTVNGVSPDVNLWPAAVASGIFVSAAPLSVVEGNRVSAVTSGAAAPALGIGVNGQQLKVFDNTVGGLSSDFGAWGFNCAMPPGTVIFARNFASGASPGQSFVNCPDDGGNVAR